jgi:hypothetical protein
VNIEDQVAALFVKANPVPSLDLLDPIELMDVDSLRDRSERSREVTEVETIQPSATQRKGRWWIPALATFAVIAVLVPVAMRAQLFDANRMTPSEEVAWAYVNALNAYDREGILELYAPDATADGLDPAEVFESVEFVGAIGWGYHDVACAEEPEAVTGGTAVACTMNIQSDWGRALALDPIAANVLIVVDDGQIVRSRETWPDDRPVNEAYDAFQTWVEENHPEDYETMYDEVGMRRVDPTAVALFQQYTDEFVAEMQP